MKKFGELLASSTLTIAGKKPQLKVNDLREASNMSNAHEVTVQAVPKEHLRENMVLIVSLLNLPSTIRSTPYLTEYALKHILTTYINALMKEGLPIPRYIICWEADEEVGGERPTITSRNFCTKDGEKVNVPCMVVSPHAYERKPMDAPALVMSKKLHEKVVKCFKRQVKEVRLVNLGARGLNDDLAPLFDVPPLDVYHPSAGSKAIGAGVLALMQASRSEDDNNDTKEKFDAMIAEQELLVDGLSNRGHPKGVPQTGNAAKGVPKKGDAAKNAPKKGAHATGKTRQPQTGKGKKGVPKKGAHAAGKTRQPQTGKAKKG